MPRIPACGDIYQIDLEPTKGKEQRGRRPVYVLTPAEFNRRGLVIVLPISQGQTLARSTGFAATLAVTGLQTLGVVICDQPRTVDFTVQQARFVETAPEFVTEDVLDRIALLVT